MMWRLVMIEDAKVRFCKRLKTSRKIRKISQEQLGITIGLDESSASARISRYENGIHTIEPNTAERIAQALDVPLAYFYASTEELAELINIFDHLDNLRQQQLLNFARSLKDE